MLHWRKKDGEEEFLRRLLYAEDKDRLSNSYINPAKYIGRQVVWVSCW